MRKLRAESTTPYVVTKFTDNSLESTNSTRSPSPNSIKPPQKSPSTSQLMLTDVEPFESKEVQQPKKPLSAEKNAIIEQIARYLNREIQLDEKKKINEKTPQKIFRPRDQNGKPIEDKKYVFSSFLVATQPNSSIEDYMKDIVRELSGISNDSLYAVVINLKRYFEQEKSDWLHPFNVHRLILTSLLVSHKSIDDIDRMNPYFVKLGGLPKFSGLKTLNNLEREFLAALKYNVEPGYADLAKMKGLIENHHLSEKSKRLAEFTFFVPQFCIETRPIKVNRPIENLRVRKI